MRTEDGFEISIDPSDFMSELYELRVQQTIKYAQVRLIPMELVADNELLVAEINEMMRLIREKVNGQAQEERADERG